MILLDYQSYNDLFNELYEPLCNYAYSVLKNFDASEDVVQEVFVHLWTNRKRIEIKSNLRNYLFSSVRNKAIEKLRRQKLEEKYINETFKKHEYHEEDEAGLEAEKYLKLQKLYNSIEKLPPKCRDIFKMAKLDGMTYNEISGELQLSVKTVESQMRRAFILLREMLYSK